MLGLEAALSAVEHLVRKFQPSLVAIDPISDFKGSVRGDDISAWLTRKIDFLKGLGITALFAALSSSHDSDGTEQQVASLMDTWLLVQAIEGNGERNRAAYILKSRGMGTPIRFANSSHRSGDRLCRCLRRSAAVLTGSARQAQEAKERSDGTARMQDLAQRRIDLEQRRDAVEAQTAAIWREFENEALAVERLLSEDSTGVEDRAGQRVEQGRLRQADPKQRDTRVDTGPLSS